MQTATRQNPDRGSALALWLAWPGDLAGPGAEEDCAAILDDGERARAARFRFDIHRREFLATHALMRVALSHAYPLPPQAWSYTLNPYGKPSPLPECGLRFNLSNSVALAVCLVARAGERAGAAAAEVGVDVEACARAAEIVPLAPRVFSAAERAQLDALPAADRPDRALSLWTLKEAYIKARGMGLALPLQGISFLFDGAGQIRFEVEPAVDTEPARWRFCQLNQDGHRIAMAVEAAVAGSVEFFTARPPLAPPKRLAGGLPSWFSTVAAAGSLELASPGA